MGWGGGEVCFVQFLYTKSSNAPVALSVALMTPLLGGVGAHKPCGKADSSPLQGDIPVTAHGARLDIDLWPPT